MSLGVVVALLLGLGVLAWLLLPIVMDTATPEARTASDERSDLEDLYIQREGTYATLKELEFDFESGKLIAEDYRELRARYSAEAVRILQRIEEMERARDQKAGRAGRGMREGTPA